MNNICQTQNNQQSLELLAAQRQLYSDAKSLQVVSLIMNVPLVIIWSALVALIPSLNGYSALWGITATLLELLVFSRIQKSNQEKAAKIQQLFDCEVLQFDWASLNCGFRIEPEIILDASNRYRRKRQNFTELQNWYPVSVGQLPIYQARIICQRSNVWWDSQLRRRYSQGIIWVLCFLTIIVSLIGLTGGLTLEKFLSAVLAPLTPAFVFGLRQLTEHNESAVKLDRLRESAETLIQEVIRGRYTPQDLERESYSLQTQIYDNRRRSPQILDWIYSRLRNENEERMNKGAELLVQELIQNP